MKKNEKKNKNADEITITFNKKKILKGAGVVLVVLLVVGLAFWASKNIKSGSNVEFKSMTISEYLDKLQDSEKSIVFVARPTCSWCQKEKPIIQKLMNKYNLTIYYLNTENFWDSSIQDYSESGYKFINSSEPYKTEQSFGTPNTIIIQGGKVIDGVYGYVEEKDLKDLFVKNGFIDE